MKKQSFCSKTPQGATEITKYTSGRPWKAASFLQASWAPGGFLRCSERAPGLAPSPELFTSAVLGSRKHKWIRKSQFSIRKKITLENSIYNLVCAPSPYWVWRLRKVHWGNPLAVQWSGLGAFAEGAWVWSLVGELISHKLLCGKKYKKKKKKKRLTEEQCVLTPTFPEVPWPWELESNRKEIWLFKADL